MPRFFPRRAYTVIYDHLVAAGFAEVAFRLDPEASPEARSYDGISFTTVEFDGLVHDYDGATVDVALIDRSTRQNRATMRCHYDKAALTANLLLILLHQTPPVPRVAR